MSDLGIRLDSPLACREELQRVANGIASLTVDHTKLLEDLPGLEDDYETLEASIYNALEPPKGATATQVKSLALEAIKAHDEAWAFRKKLKKALRDLEANERRLKSLEKRLMAAMSALKDHDNEARSSGFTGQTNYGGGGI